MHRERWISARQLNLAPAFQLLKISMMVTGMLFRGYLWCACSFSSFLTFGDFNYQEAGSDQGNSCKVGLLGYGEELRNLSSVGRMCFAFLLRDPDQKLNSA